jgi:chemotaxis signal transduction protein
VPVLAVRRRELARPRAPVVDPRSLLGAELIPLPSSARLLVLSIDGIEAGLLAEAVSGLLEAGATNPEPPPATASPSGPRW